MIQVEITFVVKRRSVDTLSSRTISFREISTLVFGALTDVLSYSAGRVRQ